MSIKLACPECDAPMKVPDEFAGRRAKCRACGKVLRIPGEKIPAANRVEELGAADLEPEEEETDGFGSDDFSLLEQLATVDASAAAVPPPDPRAERAARKSRKSAAAPAVAAPAAAHAPRPAPASAIPYRPASASSYGGGGNDSLAGGLIVGFLLMFVVTVIVSIVSNGNAAEAKMAESDGARAVYEKAGYASAVRTGVIVQKAIALGGYFAVVGPLTLLGAWIGAKLTSGRLGDHPYVRSLGVAGAGLIALSAVVLLGAAGVLPAGRAVNGLALLAFVAALAGAVFAVYSLPADKAAAAAAFAVVLALGGQFTIGLVIKGVEKMQVQDLNASLHQADWALATERRDARSSPSYANSGGSGSSYAPSQPSAPADPDAYPRARVASLNDRATELAANGPKGSREQALATLARLSADAKPYLDRPDAASLKSRLEQFKIDFATLTSEQPDPAVFKPLETAAALDPAATAGPLADQAVAAGPVSVRPPAAAKLDLKGRIDDPAGLTWTVAGDSPFTNASLNVRLAPRANAKQQRPVVATRDFMVKPAEAQRLLVLDFTDVDTEVGTVGGIPVTHAAGLKWGSDKRRVEQYVGLLDDRWLIVTVVSPADDPAVRQTLNAAARSVRPADDASPAEDPFAAERLAARLGDSPEAKSMLIALGPDAEPAVLPVLKSADSTARNAAAGVLKAIGTKASAPALLELASDGDAAARAALIRIDPKEYDAVTFALMDVERNSGFSRREGVKVLAATPPGPDDDARKQAVASALEPLLADFFMGGNKDLPAALASWATDRTPAALVGHLGEKAGSGERVLAMQVAGELKSPALVRPVVMWSVKEPKAVKASLLAMGPVAEDEVIKLLREKIGSVRALAAEVLAEIGTRKSIAPLYRAKNDPRDAGAAAAAGAAWSTVSARAKAEAASKDVAERPEAQN